ncbi:MAG: hypothetical protein IT258_00530 [Saprospiraceae bacterium]|nr:hypothetical protein [Saprospiraceae bacterium]
MSPSTSYLSPNGHYRLDIFPKEIKMSHTINCPYLFDLVDNKFIYHLSNYWDASNVEWSSDSLILSMNLMHYADVSVLFNLEINIENQTGRLYAAPYGNILGGSIDVVIGELQRTTQLRTIFY